MKVERSIEVYEKDGNSLIKDIVIDFPVDFLINLFQADRGDNPDFHKVYAVNQAQFFELKKTIPELLAFDFEAVEMYLECFSLES